MNTSATEKTLKRAQSGERVTVRKVAGEGPLRQRILDMGLTKGAEVMINKVAPLGDPIEVTVRGYELSLRKKEAACIIVR
ncbi:MAG: ferrous iron transport protein A [Akkermansia sp.]|nr:ferrous iron transport protein A [Akkermansia sp.]